MSFNLPSNFILEFTAATQMLRQIKGGKLRSKVMVGTHKGEGASPVNQYGSVEFAAPAGRFAPINLTNIDVARRWVYPNDYELAQPLDQYDLLRLIEDPRGPMTEAAVLAAGRREDRTIIAAATGVAQVGKQGGTAEAFDTANFQIPAGGVGLTLDKMREAKKIFYEANVDVEMETPTMVIGPEQWQDLISQPEVTSRDFNAGGALENGRLPNILGYDIVVTNLLPEVSAGVRGCFTFVKSGIHLGVWKDVESSFDYRPDLAGRPEQMFMCLTHGGTRLEQGRVIQILATE